MLVTRIRSVHVLLAAIALAVLPPAAPGYPGAQEQEPSPTPPDLRDLFEPGRLLADGNNDGLIDRIEARMAIVGTVDEAAIAAAANIGARLGFETTALDPGLLVSDRRGSRSGSPLILVAGSGERGAGTTSIEAGPLRPGEGVVRQVPDPTSGERDLIVSGYDATGLQASASWLAARCPAVWAPDGPTLSDVAEKLTAHLEKRGLSAAGPVIGEVVVDAGLTGIRLTAGFEIPDPDSLAAVALAFEEPGEDRGDLEFEGLHRVDVVLRSSDGSSRTVRLRPRRPSVAETPRGRGGGQPPAFTLSDLYTINGFFRDSDRDFIPDRTAGQLSLAGTDAAPSFVDLAARIGLETAGIRLPLAAVAGASEVDADGGLPLLFGVGHFQTRELALHDRLHASNGTAGQGYLEMVPDAFGEGRHGLVLSGRDPAGLEAAASYVAQRLPYVWEYGKGRFGLEEIETDVRRFFQARGAAGQSALGIHKLETWLQRLQGKEIEELRIALRAEQTPAGLDQLLEDVARRHYPDARIETVLSPTGFGVGELIFEEEYEIPWEVERVQRVLQAEAFPKLGPGSRGRIEIRVSESPEVRENLAGEIRQELANRGVPDGAFEIVVLSAYKQGYSWLNDVVLPRLRTRSVDRIEITYHTLKDSEEVRWQTIAADTRWLQEIYPIDAVMARELDLPDSAITFHPTRQADPIYRLKAFDASGNAVLEDTFDPRYVVRPFFDLFPEYEQVRVTTGWVTVETGDEVLLDQRVETDPELFWDHLQTVTYRRIIDYVMDVQEGSPSSSNAPFFDELRVELHLSEPNYRIGIDEEVISPLEALHEDIYFETLTLFDLIGARYQAGSLAYPGRVIPVIHPSTEGGSGRVSIRFTGKEHAVPELRLDWQERSAEPERWRYRLNTLDVEAPPLRGIVVSQRTEGIDRLLFEVTVPDSVDRFEEFRARSSEGAIDRSFTSVELVAGMVEALGELHRAGLFEEDLSWDRIGGLRFRFSLEDSLTWSRVAELPRSEHPSSTVHPAIAASGPARAVEPIVECRDPLGPAEAEAIMTRLSAWPEVETYYMTSSFLGRPIYVMDLLPPVEGAYRSQAKLNALRPTLFLSGRQHANEVSSTSHLLRLAELLLTDPDYRRYLDRVNVVIHPITNVDGAALDEPSASVVSFRPRSAQINW